MAHPFPQNQNVVLSDCENILRALDLHSLKDKRILVTGANGLIGQYIVSALHAANLKYRLNCLIYCISLHKPGEVLSQYIPNKSIVFRKMDLTKPFRFSEKFDYIFHAAGYGQPAKFANDPHSTIAINVTATETLLKIAERSHGVFVLFSSTEVYGEMPSGMTSFKESFNGKPSAPEGPRAVYAASKRLAEALTLFFQKYNKVKVKIVRISAVYGPGASSNDTRVMSDFIQKALTKKVIALLDGGSSVRTYGYVADVVAMILHVAVKGKSTIYNVGGQDTVSIRDLAIRIADYCGAEIRIPREASRAYFVGKDPKRVKLNLSKIKKEMKKLPHTSFRTGLANTVLWARKTGI